jgi:HK97 family phage portal protein
MTPTSYAIQVASWFGFKAGALTERFGPVLNTPSAPLVSEVPGVTSDLALQLATVWACVEKRANIIASLPLNALTKAVGGAVRSVANGSRIQGIFHESPNSRMTPFEFWRAMMINHDMRGNAYARIVRAADGEAIAWWPMPSDQVQTVIDPVGEVWHHYHLGETVFIFPDRDVLHLKGLGNGTTGLAKLEYMAGTIGEGSAQAKAAQKTFSNGGKPTAVLMADQVLKPAQRQALQERFVEMATGTESRLFVLEANMKYQQLSATPEQMQLMDARRFTTTEICRWFDVPPVVVYHAADTTVWGSGIEQIIGGWYKTSINPLVQSIEQALVKRVLTAKQRATMDVKFNLDALLRGSAKERYELYASGTSNGIVTRDECRALEDLPPKGGAAGILTAQSAQMPIDLLGKQTGARNADPQTALVE